MLPSDPLSAARWRPPPAAFDIVGLASSAGGVAALISLLSGLPEDFPLPVLVVQHLARQAPSILVDILRRHCRLRVAWAQQGGRPRPRHVYVAPQRCDLSLGPLRTLVLAEPRADALVRPEADILFHSLAQHARRPLVAVLTGMGHDGARGASAVRDAGGVVLAQDQATSRAFGMPRATIEVGAAHFVLPLERIPPALVSLAMVPGSTALFGLPERTARTAQG